MKRLAACLFLETLFLFSLSVAAADTRLAIGSFGLASEKLDGELADLIAVRLSGAPKIDLVERRELNKALNEATLSLAGLAKAGDAVRLGALLRADQFLLGTSVPINGTNRLMVRLVDAHSGAIRAINVFGDLASMDTLAQAIAGFVSAEVGRPAQGQRDYLAIGVIQNLGVNNRFSDFPAQMRGSMAAKFSGKVTVLERDVISFLANEVRMNLAGLTESAGHADAPVQFGFWIVDGFYQSYEVAEPEVQLNLRVERVLGGHNSYLLQGKPNEQFLAKICETIEQELKRPGAGGRATPPTRQGEIAALEARGRQLADYAPTKSLFTRSLRLRTSQNPDKVINTLDEATRVYESLLLLDPDNMAAKMRLAACLLFQPEPYSGITRDHLAERSARANDFYREVISTGHPEYAVEAQIRLAESCGGLGGVEMLRRFSHETTDPKEAECLRESAGSMLYKLECVLPVETILPGVRTQVFDELRVVEQSTNGPFIVTFENALLAYRFRPENREKIINALLPELLKKFPALEPYILLAAAGEQIEPDSPVIARFLASLQECEAHPEAVLQPSSYFADLSSYERTFDNRQYSTVVARALANQRAAVKGLAPPLSDTGKRLLAQSYAALNQWQKALDLYETLPEVTPQVKNECRSHLNLGLESETISDSAWKDLSDINKVGMAYDCMGRKQWLTAAAILDSMRHRTVRMNTGGAWGWAFAPVLPAVVANECRAKAGEPPVRDPMRFDLGDTPYIHFLRDGPRVFGFEVEGDDVWVGTYSEIKRFRGPGPFAATEPVEAHPFERFTKTWPTCICLSPNFIWLGTIDDGLFELDRDTGNIRRITMKDGLLLNGISDLYLRGQTLWIAYQNKDNGSLGTLDLRKHKFSALTPSLRPEPGENFQPYHTPDQMGPRDQPPQFPISCMTEGAPGEMWFGVVGKGLQSYSTSDGRWETVVNTFESSTHLSGIASDSARDQMLVTTREKGVLDGEKSHSGGLILYDYRQHRRAGMSIYQGLPSNDLTAVAIDGRVAWIGGRGFVAVVDIEEQKVLRIAYISANCIKKILLGKTAAWIQVISGGTDAYVEYSGNAWTGVYRVERSAVERIP
jgi:tetratricopeptide (TPR) repeat protein